MRARAIARHLLARSSNVHSFVSSFAPFFIKNKTKRMAYAVFTVQEKKVRTQRTTHSVRTNPHRKKVHA